MYYPAGQKFARNRSISSGFRDIHTFSFSAKIQDGCQKWRKLKILITLSNQNFQFYCATIAYHVGLIAESNRPVEGLQLRLEDMFGFLNESSKKVPV